MTGVVDEGGQQQAGESQELHHDAPLSADAPSCPDELPHSTRVHGRDANSADPHDANRDEHCDGTANGVRTARSREELTAELQDIERQLADVRANRLAQPQHTAQRYAQLEQQLWTVMREVARLEPEMQGLGHPIMAEAVSWRDDLKRLKLQEAATAASALLKDLADDEAAAHQAAADAITQASETGPSAEACFNALMQLSSLQWELLDGVPRDSQPDLDETREQLRSAMLSALERNPEQATETLRDSWKEDLTNRASVVLTAIDDEAPADAARHLKVAIDDLDWHCEHVETRGLRNRQIRGSLWRLRSEWQERVLQSRMEKRFGRTAVAWLERVVLVMIVVVFILLMVELLFDLSPTTLDWLEAIDVVCCTVFLSEFAIKIALAPLKGRWFVRHLFVDLIPSIPFGLIFGGGTVDSVRAARLARLLRLPRLTRYIRLLRPFVRMLRAFGFLARGLDRTMRRYGSLLNRDIVLYPTSEERRRAEAEVVSLTRRARRVNGQVYEAWNDLLGRSGDAARSEVALARIDSLRHGRTSGVTTVREPTALGNGTARELPAETLLRRLAAVTPQDLESTLSQDLVSRIGRFVRVCARPPVCWLPVISRFVPHIHGRMRDAEVAAAGARSLASGLKQMLDRWLWAADLYGTVTPSQFVDRLGSMMVMSSFRPTYRLALAGGFLILTELMLQLTQLEALAGVKSFLNRFVGPTVLMLGSVCCVIFVLGWWLKRLAREATQFYERSARAQFLSLTEVFRSRHVDRDAEILHQRVMQHEWRLQTDVPQDSGEQIDIFLQRLWHSLMGIQVDAEDPRSFDLIDRAVMLYRDSLDGSMFAESDIRTTSQLLGNPAVQQILSASGRVNRKELKALRTLDLRRQHSLIGGPYLWFNFISRSIMHSVACLLVEYNRMAIPLDDLPTVSPKELARYQAWLASENLPVVSTDVPDVASYATTAFTTLHFLDTAPHRDRYVLERFGPQVLARLQRDRSLLIRRIFGMYPLHQLTRQRRILNLRTFYETRLAGGRALLLPLYAVSYSVWAVGRLLVWLRYAVREIRRPELRMLRIDAADADFGAAVRKIDRMRGPVVDATMRLRMRIDPEYLGVAIPGEPPIRHADVDEDLRFLDPEPLEVEHAQAERARAQSDMQRLQQLIEEGLLDRIAERLKLPVEALRSGQRMRAAAVAYLADYREVRRLLSGGQILDEVYHAAPLRRMITPRPRPHFRLRRMFHKYWNLHGLPGKDAKRAAWLATVQNLDGVAHALDAWYRYGDNAAELGEQRLADLLRHPTRISEQLVTLRTVQSLALLDVLNYRTHVFRLGNYAETEHPPRELLEWNVSRNGHDSLR